MKSINVIIEKTVENNIKVLKKSLKSRIRKVIFSIMDGMTFDEALLVHEVSEKAFWLLLGKDRKASEWLDQALRARYTKAAIRMNDLAEDYRTGRLDDRSALVESKLLSASMPLMKAKIAHAKEEEGDGDDWDSLSVEDRIALFSRPVHMIDSKPTLTNSDPIDQPDSQQSDDNVT